MINLLYPHQNSCLITHQTKTPATKVHVAGVPSSPTNLGSTCPVTGDGWPRVNILYIISKQTITDTGNTHTLIDSIFHAKLPLGHPLLPPPWLLSVTGEVPTTGIIIITIAGKCHCVVCPKLGADLLLGSDFLEDCILDLPKRLLYYHATSYPIQTDKSLADLQMV